MTNKTEEELREQILDILRWPNNKGSVRLTQSEALRRQRADEILALLQTLITEARKQALKSRVATVTTIAKDDPLQDAYDTWVDVNGQRFGIMFETLHQSLNNGGRDE